MDSDNENEYESINSFPIVWEAYEYEHLEKTQEWFWTIIIVFFAASAATYILGNFLFSVFIFLSGITLALRGIRKPRILEFSINARGVQAGDKLYLYKDLESFWVFYDPPFRKSLSLKSKKPFLPYIEIPLAEIDPNEARETLLKFIKEKEHKESFLDELVRNTGF